MDNQITRDQLIRVLPGDKSKNVSDEMIDHINDLCSDQMLRENYRDNILGFASVMADGKFRIPDYLNAVRYVSFKLLGSSNIVAYTKTFPDRYQRLKDEGTDPTQIASFVGAYNRTKLVQLIMEQTLTPQHVLNMDLYQRALNVQADLMVNANSEKVRTDAANSLLTQLRQPEKKQVAIDVNVTQDKSIDELRKTTMALAEQQRKAIAQGVSTEVIAHSKIIKDESVVSEQ